MIKALRKAFAFLTILPFEKRRVMIRDVARSCFLFPFVGLIVGGFLAGTGYSCDILFPLFLQRGCILLVWVIITGALHLDGFIDCCDALFAPVTGERRLEILKDVHVGAFGITGAILLLLFKYLLLVSIRQNSVLYAGLFLVPVLGRSSLVYVIGRYPYARENGCGKAFHERCGIKEYISALFFPIVVAVTLYFFFSQSWIVFLLIPATWGIVELIGIWIMKRLPGFTGDVYGAVCEIIEVTGLAGFILLERFAA
ncbi:MAG: adenosylcobinamide-GDP ribazoletransferase [Spirochaetales bacterium]|nr:adenosylcobinamide-GDP ribazoletransferase [Spirochaetales bacterium]